MKIFSNRKVWRAFGLLALAVLMPLQSQAQIFISVEGVGGQSALFEGAPDQYLNIFAQGSGEFIAGANFRFQIGETGQTAPAIQAVDLIGTTTNPTFWAQSLLSPTGPTNPADGFLLNVTYSPTRQAAEGVISITETQPPIALPSSPTLFARVQIDGTSFAAGESFNLYFNNILGNSFLDTQILDSSGAAISTSFSSSSVTFTPVPEPEDAVLWVGLGLLIWTGVRRKKHV